MAYKFKIIKNYYDERELFSKDEIEFEKGVTVLVGCNGSGKTTLIRQISKLLDEDKEVYKLEYNNLIDGGSNKLSDILFRGESNAASELAIRAFGSEGENIYYNIGDMIRKLGAAIHNSTYGKKKIFVLFDAIDSGLSIDNCNEVNDVIKNVIIPDAETFNVELYIIVSTNTFEFARTNKCIDVQSLKYIDFKDDYNKYKKYIEISRVKKDKALDKYWKSKEKKKKENKSKHDFDLSLRDY